MELTNELFHLVQPHNRFIRPERFWEKEDFKGITNLLIVAAAIYFFGLSGVGWFFIGLSLAITAYIFYELSTCKGGGCVSGVMLLPAIILFVVGGLMVGSDALTGLFQ